MDPNEAGLRWFEMCAENERLTTDRDEWKRKAEALIAERNEFERGMRAAFDGKHIALASPAHREGHMILVWDALNAVRGREVAELSKNESIAIDRANSLDDDRDKWRRRAENSTEHMRAAFARESAAVDRLRAIEGAAKAVHDDIAQSLAGRSAKGMQVNSPGPLDQCPPSALRYIDRILRSALSDSLSDMSNSAALGEPPRETFLDEQGNVRHSNISGANDPSRRATRFASMPGGGVCRCLNDASPVVCDDCPWQNPSAPLVDPRSKRKRCPGCDGCTESSPSAEHGCTCINGNDHAVATTAVINCPACGEGT
jgi:hypothetical protein